MRLSVCLCVLYMISRIVKIVLMYCVFFFQAEDGIRDLVRSRGLGDVYKRQSLLHSESSVMTVKKVVL